MKIERITNTDHADWSAVWSIFTVSFPKGEQRTLEAQRSIFKNDHYHFNVWYDDQGDLLGFMAWWSYDRFSFLEHFAIDSKKRSGGIGSTMLTEWMQKPHPAIILEIDPITDEISRRRWAFYDRLGFLKNEYEHGHPSYFDGSGWVPLWVLSYPDRIDEPLYREFRRLELDEMLAHLSKSQPER